MGWIIRSLFRLNGPLPAGWILQNLSQDEPSRSLDHYHLSFLVFNDATLKVGAILEKDYSCLREAELFARGESSS
jgi:hypothetical protein